MACGRQAVQKELVRIVRTSLGDVQVDEGRRKVAGRGAYLCGTPECWEQGLNKGRLEYSLKGKLAAGDRERLQEFAKTLDSQE